MNNSQTYYGEISHEVLVLNIKYNMHNTLLKNKKVTLL